MRYALLKFSPLTLEEETSLTPAELRMRLGESAVLQQICSPHLWFVLFFFFFASLLSPINISLVVCFSSPKFPPLLCLIWWTVPFYFFSQMIPSKNGTNDTNRKHVKWWRPNSWEIWSWPCQQRIKWRCSCWFHKISTEQGISQYFQ